jgi:dTDP-4-dehydrorhamnose 3,5-epimerase
LARFVQSAHETELEVDPPGARDRPTVDPATRERLASGIEGVRLYRLSPHVDHRGSLTEVVNFDLPFWDEPVVYAYRFTIRPGRIKGWGMHRLQADRYLAASGQVRVVLFDGRAGSPSQGAFDQFHFDETASGLLYIPPGVWHADQNAGEREAVLINFPTRAYDPADPDKYRIDPHSGEIPFDWTLADG